MTPFMLRVADIVGADTTDELDLPEPALQRSVFRPINKGNDLHVAYRGLTEQLVCEANAMLPAEDDRMTLVDDVVGNEMLYSVYYRGRAAVISTVFGEGRAFGRVVADGLDNSVPHELAGPESVEDLLLLLLMESDAPRHPAH
ncbi:MAG TPA: hypothetical protein VFL59_16025 [Candidatus Nanopelagicales bacterium]|nr:hypothetical protein [Candidatus Nanopelagicales bacterium]